MSKTRLIFLAELVAYTGAGTATFYYASEGMVTGPAETPASTYYDGRILQPANVRRTLFDVGTTQGRSTTGVGELVLNNSDGGLDAFLAYGVDGRAITLRVGTITDNTFPAYPSGYTTVLVGTMEQVDFPDTRTVVVKIRDNQFALSVPFQTTKFAGTNTLPTGLEGVADLKGKPKPVVMGKVTGIAPPMVNTSKLIYQLHDGALASVDRVYDRGVRLYGPTWVTKTAAGATAIYGASYNATSGLWMICGSDGAAGECGTSTDGTTWSDANAGFGAATICYSVANSGALWDVCAGGEWRSTADGTTWSAITEPAGWGATTPYAIAYGNGVWVVAGSSGQLASSTDAATWTNRTSGFGADHVRGVAYGNKTWVIVGGTGKVATSTDDGVTWTLGTGSWGTTSAVRITFAQDDPFRQGQFVMCGAGGILATSPDGLAWTSRTSGETAQLNGVAYAQGRWIIVGVNGVTIESKDGWNWRKITSASGGVTLNFAVGDGDQLILAVGSSAPALVLQGATGTNYGALADLSDDSLAPEAGGYKTYLAGGYIRLGSPPAGLVTADCTQGATAADRTAAQLYDDVLVRAGKSTVAGDLTALDALDASVCGVWISEETDCGTVADMLANTVGAWWGCDRSGLYRIKRVVAPVATAVASYTTNDLLAMLRRVAMNDPAQGLPVYKTVLRHTRNYTVQTTDLAGGVTAARRAVVGLDWQETTATDAAVQTTYLLAAQTLEETYYTLAANAATEATRRQTMRGVKRDRFLLVLSLDATNAAVDLGDVITLTHATRYALSAGKKFLVIGVDPDAAQRRVTLTVWG